jgi:hypothetical protein
MQLFSRTLEKSASEWKKVRSPIIALLILAPIVGTAFLSFHYGLEVPRTDSWDVIPALLQKQSAGQLSFWDFWAQHNEQRILFPRLVMYGLAQISGWNFKVGIGFNLILLTLVFVVLWRLLQTTLEEELRFWLPWLLVTFSWITFTTVPWQNLIWEISGTLFFMNVLAGTVSFWSLARWPGQLKGTCFAALAATVSMYSLGNGVLVWAVGLGMLLLARRRRLNQVLCWFVCAAATTAAYFYGFVSPTHQVGARQLTGEPLSLAQYASTLLGAPWQHSLSIEAWVGLLGAALFMGYTAWALRKGGTVLEKLLPWLAIGWFVLINPILTGISRASFGVRHAFAPRYVSITNLFWIAFVVTSFTVISYYIKVKEDNGQAARSLYALGSILAIMLTLGYADAYEDGIKIMRQESREVSKHNLCVFSGCYYEQCGGVLNIGPEKFKDRTELLRRLKMGPFRDSVSPGDLDFSPETPKPHPGKVEVVSWRRTSSSGEPTLFIKGWVLDTISDKPVRKVLVLSEGKLVGLVPLVRLPTETTKDRKDPGQARSAWQVCAWPSHQRGEAPALRAYALLDKDNRAIKLQGDFLVPKE